MVLAFFINNKLSARFVCIEGTSLYKQTNPLQRVCSMCNIFFLIIG